MLVRHHHSPLVLPRGQCKVEVVVDVGSSDMGRVPSWGRCAAAYRSLTSRSVHTARRCTAARSNFSIHVIRRAQCTCFPTLSSSPGAPRFCVDAHKPSLPDTFGREDNESFEQGYRNVFLLAVQGHECDCDIPQISNIRDSSGSTGNASSCITNRVFLCIHT